MKKEFKKSLRKKFMKKCTRNGIWSDGKRDRKGDRFKDPIWEGN